MLRRIFAIVLIVLGLGTAGAALASGTIWRPAEVVTATLPQEPDVPVVVAGGNVLATVNPNVTVTLTAADADTPLVLAMGREADVRAWLDGSPYEEVTGLTDWDTLAVTEGPAESEDPSATEDESATDEPSEDSSATDDASAAPSEDATGDEQAEDSPADATVPDPAGSDLWIEQVTGTGELTYDWSQVEGRWMMLVATDGTQPAPDVSMTWTREVTTPLVVPGLIVGGVLFLIGLVWLVVELLVHREERHARRARSADSADEAAPAVPTTAEDGTPLTRREIREAARAAARKGGASSATGATAPSAEDTTSTPATGVADEEAPSDWTAIISGGPAAETSSEGDQPVAGTEETPEPQETEPSDGTASSASGATDLDEWVRSGRTGDEAGPVSTYESPAPGRGLGAEPAGDLGLAWQGTPAHDDAAAPDHETGQSADGTSDDAAGPPRRWWQRRKRNDAGAQAAGARGGAPATDDAPDPASDDDSGADAGQGSDAVDEPNPQASGASWRQTWGLTTASSPQPAETEPDRAETDPAPGDEEGDR